MDEQTLDLKLEAESQAIAAAIVTHNLNRLFESYTDTHSYEGERRSALRRAEMNDWGWN